MKSRNPRSERGPHDLSEVLNLNDIVTNDSDCFGRLFDLSASACGMCHDNDVCGVVFDHYENKPKKKIVKRPFVDLYNFQAVRDSSLPKLLVEYEGEYSREELFKAVSEIANCDDANLVNDFITSLLEDLKMKVDNGFIVRVGK